MKRLVVIRHGESTYILLGQMDLMWIPMVHSWRPNERHYDELQGLDQSDTV